jgi:drug/metabolite transporter (DMT)-like permease
MKNRNLQGYLYTLLAATLWGTSGVAAKFLFNTGLAPLQLVQIRVTLSVILLLGVFLLFNRTRLVISRRDLPYFLVFGILGLAGSQTTYYLTVSKIQVGPAVLIQYLCPVWITLYASLFQGEPISKKMGLALLLAVAGCYFVAGGYRFDLLKLNREGVMIGVISSFFVAFYSLYAEKGLKRYDAWTVLFYGLATGTVFYLFLLPPARMVTAGFTLKTWLLFFYIAIFATIIPFALFFKGIERIRASRASITANWEPVMACLAAYLVLGETLEPLQALGGVGVISAVVLLQLARETTGPSSALEIRQNTRMDS